MKGEKITLIKTQGRNAGMVKTRVKGSEAANYMLQNGWMIDINVPAFVDPPDAPRKKPIDESSQLKSLVDAQAKQIAELRFLIEQNNLQPKIEKPIRTRRTKAQIEADKKLKK